MAVEQETPVVNVPETLSAWKASQCKAVDIGGLWSRNKIAHKWKATFRSLSIREGDSWRTQALLAQSLLLHESKNALGARILLRSAFESVAVLIYLNQLTRMVLAGSLNFHDFTAKTSTLLLGSRDNSTDIKALNIVTVLEKCDARYPGLWEMYTQLSESAHPNYEGTSIGYSDVDQKHYVTTYSNKWDAMYGEHHLTLMQACIKMFYCEYNSEWKDAFEKLEQWITENDATLEATKGAKR